MSQPAFFRTKGLPGLNASPNVGDELTPYVASTYPPDRSVPLYRNEPVALAFTEDMSNLLPVDRVAAAGRSAGEGAAHAARTERRPGRVDRWRAAADLARTPTG